ncbi:MAG: hypothetical protein C5B44_05635 [Acidobacteria bacterium]|nr:MAG: hypothetical protein C5B44_05635 [Acidobacteriota bacterium]
MKYKVLITTQLAVHDPMNRLCSLAVHTVVTDFDNKQDALAAIKIVNSGNRQAQQAVALFAEDSSAEA